MEKGMFGDKFDFRPVPESSTAGLKAAAALTEAAEALWAAVAPDGMPVSSISFL